MNCLALDTSGRHVSLALSVDGVQILEYNERLDDTVSERLPDLFEQVLRPVLGDLDRLNHLVACHGPGPFTSIRIGLTVCKSLIIGLPGLTFAVYDSLLALAAPYLPLAKPVLTLMDARRAEHYVAVHQLEGCRITQTVAPFLLGDGQLPDWLRRFDPLPLIAGIPTRKVIDMLESDGFRVLTREPFLAGDLLKLVLREEPQWLTDTQELKPLYLREPDAALPKT